MLPYEKPNDLGTKKNYRKETKVIFSRRFGVKEPRHSKKVPGEKRYPFCSDAHGEVNRMVGGVTYPACRACVQWSPVQNVFPTPK